MAGYGLPRGAMDTPTDIGFSYKESSEGAGIYTPAPNSFNDASGEPRAFVLSNNGNTAANNSDVLVIKSVVSVLDETTFKSTVRYYDSATDSYRNRTWSDASMNPVGCNKVISINATNRKIVYPAGVAFSAYNADGTCGAGVLTVRPDTAIAQGGDSASFFTYLTYVVHSGTDSAGVAVDPRMPFNRVDYYLGKTFTTNHKCHPNTYALYRAGIKNKADIKQAGGARDEQILMDCVADFQVAFGIDTTGSGLIDTWDDGTLLSTYEARDISARVKMVKVFILTHEGLFNNEFTFTGTTQIVTGLAGTCTNSNTTFCIGDDEVFLKSFALNGLGTTGSADYKRYKWTQLVLSGKSMNLCQESTASCLGL
jgi:hypothetical protein